MSKTTPNTDSLHAAAAAGDLEVVKAQIKEREIVGISVDAGRKVTPLAIAIMSEHYEMAKVLIEAGAYVGPEMAEALIKAGAYDRSEMAELMKNQNMPATNKKGGEFNLLAQLYIVVNLKRFTTIKVRNHDQKLHSDFSL